MKLRVTQFHCPQKLPEIQASDWCHIRVVIVYVCLLWGQPIRGLLFGGKLGESGIAVTLYRTKPPITSNFSYESSRVKSLQALPIKISKDSKSRVKTNGKPLHHTFLWKPLKTSKGLESTWKVARVDLSGSQFICNCQNLQTWTVYLNGLSSQDYEVFCPSHHKCH